MKKMAKSAFEFFSSWIALLIMCAVFFIWGLICGASAQTPGMEFDDIDADTIVAASLDEIKEEKKFHGPSNGAGVGFGVNFNPIDLSEFDLPLSAKSRVLLRSIDFYVVHGGLMLGTSSFTTFFYTPPEVYDEFKFDFVGGIIAYEHELLYEKLKVRCGLFVGQTSVKIIKNRPEITIDSILNPLERQILERVFEDQSPAIRPFFGIGWQPVGAVQLRLESSYFYPTGGEEWNKLRKPFYTVQIVIGG